MDALVVGNYVMERSAQPVGSGVEIARAELQPD